MEIIQELLPGVLVLKPSTHQDNRGSLTIDFPADDIFVITQTMRSVSGENVIRGLHYQDRREPVAKLVSCQQGSIYDVVVDLRPNSQSYGSWVTIELSRYNGYQLLIPFGFAHGYASLTDQSEVFYYQMGAYNAEASHILAWDDPDLNIEWPVKNPILSDRDKSNGISWADYQQSPHF